MQPLNPEVIMQSESPNPAVPSVSSKRSLTPIKIAVLFGLLFVAGVAGYSLYVAIHEPDPQETVILGQTKLAAGSPAGLRILVRNRVSGKPVGDASVEISLSGKARETDRESALRRSRAAFPASPTAARKSRRTGTAAPAAAGAIARA